MIVPSTAALTPADTGERVVVIRDRLTFKGRLGDLTMAEVEVAPYGEVPLHSHDSAELFYILDGTLEFATAEPGGRNGRVTAVSAGDTLAIPSRTPHSYRNGSPSPARMLALFDAGLEAFFRSAGTAGPEMPDGPPRPEELERVMAAAAAHAITILGSHGGAPAA